MTCHTYHWYREKELPRESWNEFAKDAAKIVKRGSKILAEEYDKIWRRPVANEDKVRFNGIGYAGHEVFYIPRVMGQLAHRKANGKYFSFCKTAGKPYDEYVVEVLLLAEKHFGDKIEVGSDVDWEETRRKHAIEA